MNYSELLDDLRTEADLCRNETADDIAKLLDDAADAIEASQRMLRQLRSDVLSVMPENWREDPDWAALADAQKLTPNAEVSGAGTASAGLPGYAGWGNEVSRTVTEEDFRMPEFRGKDPNDYEFRADGKVVRKDRWETAIHSIRYALGDNRREFEISDIVDAVRAVVATIPESESDDDADA